MNIRSVLGYFAVAAVVWIPTCQGQGLFDQVNFRTAEVGGIHLYGVSVFSGYSTSAYPQGFGQVALPGQAALGPDMTYGASASVGWQLHRERTNLSIMYSSSYGGNVRYSDANALSHSLSLSATRTLGPKWSASLSGSAQDTTLAQFLFQPQSLSILSQLPATFDDLAAAFSAGQFSNSQIASMLTGAPILESPARSLLLGDRIRSYGVQASLNYAYSSRLNFHLSSFSAGGQSRSGGLNGVAGQNFVMPRSIGANGGMGMSYALSPRTQLGFDLEENRSVNRFQGSYGTTASASLGRKMGTHWFLSIHGGGSFSQITQQMYGSPKTRQAIGGGSIGFQTYANTLVASYERSGSDNFGFAVGTNTTMMGSWSWRLPGRRWSVVSSFGQQQMRNNGFASISGWMASTGYSRSLNAQTSLSAQYVYSSNTGNYLGNVNNLSVHSIRVSMGWSPQTPQR